MEKRGTAHMIEPEIYVVYALILKHGISPHRALELWGDTSYYNSGRETLKSIIKSALKEYWLIHDLNGDNSNLNDCSSSIKFIKRYIYKPSIFRRFWNWLRR